MRQQRLISICLYLALLLPAYGSNLNTECNIEDNAIQSDLSEDQKAAAPKVCFDVAETERCFYLLLPECAKEKPSVALVVDVHDTGKCPVDQSRISGWKEYALRGCFAVAWPLGNTDASVTDEPCFTVPGGLEVTNELDGSHEGVAPDCCCKKDGQFIHANATNDIDFLHQMISRAVDEAGSNGVSVNTTSVKLTGYGNGATAAMGFTAMHSDVVACLAPFSGHMVTPFAEDYSPVPVFSVLDSANAQVDEHLTEDFIGYPAGSEPLILPSPSRVDSFFAEANQCGEASSRSHNTHTDEITRAEGVVTGGKFTDCEEPVNFLKPPFAAYKTRDTVSSLAKQAGPIDISMPVNRVVDTTGIAILFCKDRQSVNSAYEFPASSAHSSRSIAVPAMSLLALVATYLAT